MLGEGTKIGWHPSNRAKMAVKVFGGNEGFVNLSVRDRDGVWIFLIRVKEPGLDLDWMQYLRLRERGLSEGDLRPSSRSTREGLLSFEEKCLIDRNV